LPPASFLGRRRGRPLLRGTRTWPSTASDCVDSCRRPAVIGTAIASPWPSQTRWAWASTPPRPPRKALPQRTPSSRPRRVTSPYHRRDKSSNAGPIFPVLPPGGSLTSCNTRWTVGQIQAPSGLSCRVPCRPPVFLAVVSADFSLASTPTGREQCQPRARLGRCRVRAARNPTEVQASGLPIGGRPRGGMPACSLAPGPASRRPAYHR